MGKVWEFAKARKGEYVVSVLMALIGVACSIMPYVIIIDLIRNMVSGTAERSWCLQQCVYMGLWWIARYIFHSVSSAMSHHATFAVLGNIRLRLLEKMSTLPLGTVLEQSSGSYKNTIVERVDSIETTLAHILPEFTSNICGALAVFIMIFQLDWRLALSMLIVFPIGMGCFLTMFNGYEANFQRTIDSTKALNDTAVEYINGIEVIKAFGQSKTSYAKFVEAAREGASCFVDWMQKCIFGQAGGMAIFPATLLGLIPVGCILSMRGALDTATFISAIALSFGVMQPLIVVFSYTDDLAQITVVMNDVTSILEKEDLQRAETVDQLPADHRVTMKDVYFSYDDKEVLHGVSLELKPGTVNALVGPSGSGKSTIAKLIASLWDVQAGSIRIGGVDIKKLPLEECTKRIAYVSQDNYLFNQSIMDNIRMGRQGASDQEVIEAAKACGCHDFIRNLEHGYDTICGSSGGHLSGGERQRISIARAMLKDAPIIILDEATSYTDPENEAVIQASLAKLVQGKTLLMIAHRLSTISHADQILVVENGRIAARGTQDELLSSCPLYKEMWDAHMSVKDREKDEEVPAL